MKVDDCGLWILFLWVEKYVYVFLGLYNKVEVVFIFDDGLDLEFMLKILDKLK